MTAANRPKTHKYISRNNGLHRWEVRIGMDAINFKPVRKSFSDGVYGSKRKALRAAKLFRDCELRLLQAKGHYFGVKRYRELGSGIIYREFTDKDDCFRQIVIAQYWDNKKQKQIKREWSIRIHGGKRKTMALATTWREEQLKRLNKRQPFR